MTTFTSRKPVRDKLAQLHRDSGAWSNVYSGMPNFKKIAGDSPICFVLSGGTDTKFENANTNPREHDFVITTMVLYAVRTTIEDGWTYIDAEDLLDSLEQKSAQIIRDNADGAGVASLFRFEGASEIRRGEIINRNFNYTVEMRTVTARLNRGAL
ncbi:MAG: hypothetical protein AAF126_03065 [Chloroflexota bacterium]